MIKRQLLAGAGLTTLILCSSGCSYLFGDEGLFPDNSESYKQAQELPVIDVPEGKDSQALQEAYPIPAIQESLVLEGEFEVPRPTPLVAGASDQIVRIQKLGNETWALVAVAPGQLWPQVRSFLSAAGGQVARVDARAGVMETSWVQPQGQDMASRYRFRIERGVQRGTSELHVLHQHQAGDIHRWPEVSDDFTLEADMLRAVAQYVANSADSAPVSMIADQSISASGKITLQESREGYTYIRVELPYGRAWASLSRALEASDFEITDRDRSAGEYYTRFVPTVDEEDGGWFDWLFDEDEHPLTGQEFLVTAQAQDDASVVHIRLRPLDAAAPFSKREEQALLAIIKGNIN